MSKLGHNERSYRLDVLASEARAGLENVTKGEEFTIGGWLAYGHALNEGRALFPSDEQFGQWVKGNLPDTEQKVREAAMWAAANADQFEEARQRGNPRTIRGIHAKWKEIEAEREAEVERQEIEARKAAQEPAPVPVVAQEAMQSKPNQEVHREQETENKGENAKDHVSGHQPAATDQEPVQEAAPDPHAKLRREFRSLTQEGQEDDWIGLREEVEELRKRVKSQTSMISDLKREVKELSSDEKNEVIRNLQAKCKNAENARWKALEDRDAYHRQVHALKKRVGELEKLGVAY